MLNLETTTWTTGSVVSNTTGLPFKIPIDGNEYHSDNFMNGSYALGDMLKKHGYYNELISSAHTSFGGFNEYFR
jgi:phosphoglycerol transferase